MISVKFMAVGAKNIALLNFSKNCFANTTFKRLVGAKSMTSIEMRGMLHDYINVISVAKRYGLMADMTIFLKRISNMNFKTLEVEYVRRIL